MTAGIVAATALITATTLDDAVWLVPYCAGSHLPFSTKAIHALTFIGTLELLAGLCVVCVLLEWKNNIFLPALEQLLRWR